MFELIEKALDAIALTVERLVEGQDTTARGQRRDHRFDPLIAETFADAVGIIAPIQQGVFNYVLSLQAFVEGFELAAIVGLPRRQMEGDATVLIDRRRVNFGRQSATRASQSLVAGVFFGAPAAC